MPHIGIKRAATIVFVVPAHRDDHLRSFHPDKIFSSVLYYMNGWIYLFETIKFIFPLKTVRHVFSGETIFIHHIKSPGLYIVWIRVIEKPGTYQFSIPGPVMFISNQQLHGMPIPFNIPFNYSRLRHHLLLLRNTSTALLLLRLTVACVSSSVL